VAVVAMTVIVFVAMMMMIQTTTCNIFTIACKYDHDHLHELRMLTHVLNYKLTLPSHNINNTGFVRLEVCSTGK
jgi:hypothetical protein